MKKLSNKKIVDILLKAKRILINGDIFYGLCFCISNAYYSEYGYYLCYENINEIIPKFNPNFLNTTRKSDGYWWAYNDINSRIKALNKLIEYYRNRSLFYIIIDKIKYIKWRK